MPARTLGYMVTWAHGLMGAGTRVGMGSRLHGLLVHGGVGPWTHYCLVKWQHGDEFARDAWVHWRAADWGGGCGLEFRGMWFRRLGL